MKRPSDEEASLFRDAVRDVKPLRPGKRAAVRGKPPPPRARYARAAAPTAGNAPQGVNRTLATGDSLEYFRPGATRERVRDLRRGRVRPAATLDLHGLDAARAERALADFLGEAIERGARCVRVVHGKGLHSGADGPVLKNLVDAVLRRTPGVLAFASTRPAEGGTGAVHVLLGR